MAEGVLSRLRPQQQALVLRALAMQEAQRMAQSRGQRGALSSLAQRFGFPVAPGAQDRLSRLPQDMVAGAPVVGDIASSVGRWAQENPLDAGALAVSPVPVLGDIAGLANDMRHYATDPESRTWANYGMTALGALPLVPSLAGGTMKMVNDAPSEATRVPLVPMREIVGPVERVKKELQQKGWGVTTNYAGTGTIYMNISPKPGEVYQIRIADHGKRVFETDDDYFNVRLADRTWRDGKKFDMDPSEDKILAAIAEIDADVSAK